jgi:hypothetical protein
MQNRTPFVFTLTALALSFSATQAAFAKDNIIRAGIIGCDTSHVEAFTKIISKPDAPAPINGVKVVAAFPGGSPDMQKESMQRVPGYVKKLQGMGVKIVDSIDELAGQCDAFMVESVDGRPHLKQFQAIAKGKPVFIDKPAAGSLADLLTIYRIADETHTPVFSSSSLRFVPDVVELAHEKSIGDMIGCDTVSPMSVEKHHPDLFWYGIHGVEPLVTIMGTGCDTVSRTDSKLSAVVVGKWNDGRIGTFRGLKEGYYYSFTVAGSKKLIQRAGPHTYDPMIAAMCEFFKTGKSPVPREQTIEIYAFMEAADASKMEGGKPVKISDIIERAEKKSKATTESVGGDRQ